MFPPPCVAVAVGPGEEQLRQQVRTLELTLQTVQKAHTDAVERCAVQQAEGHRALLQMRDEVAYKESIKWQERLQAAEGELRSAKQRVAELESDIAMLQARTKSGWAPQASEFAALEQKLEAMAREQAAREAKWQAILQDTKQLYDVQADLAQRRWESALASKNAEIEAFRTQVDELLSAARRLQH